MSGISINVIPRTPYKFDTVIASSGAFSFPIARFIDISRYREITGIVRIHARSLLATGAPKITVIFIADDPSSMDPAQDFLPPSGQGQAQVDITNATVAPSVALVALPANLGPMISVWLQVAQGTSTAALSATLSVDVSMKS